MDKQEELISKIISLSEERMRLFKLNNNDNSLNWEKINKRINDIPLEVESLKKELYSMIEVKEEKEKASYLNMLTQEEVAKKLGTTKQNISVLREIGLIQAIKALCSHKTKLNVFKKYIVVVMYQTRSRH